MPVTRPIPRRAAGFSLIELMITVTLIAILLVMVVPSFGTWNADARARSVAESLTNAIRQTQSAAVGNGRTSLFALTADTSPTVTSTPSASGPNWVAELNVLGGSDETQAKLGTILKSSEASASKVTVTGPALMCFNALGRQTALAAGSTNFAVACASADPQTFTVSRASASRSYKVLVYAGGRVRMCDAAKTLSSTNPDGC